MRLRWWQTVGIIAALGFAIWNWAADGGWLGPLQIAVILVMWASTKIRPPGYGGHTEEEE